jgi:YgiT-type zinc finger domain-containing protein
VEQGFQAAQTVTCVICRQAKVFAGRTTVRFERGEFQLVVSEVPARSCAHCGESYIEEDVVERLLEQAEELLRAGVADAYQRYASPQI